MKGVKLLYLAEGFGLGSAIIGSIGILGYFLNEPLLYTWKVGVGMALPTAIALTASGLGVICCALSYDIRTTTTA